MNNTQMNGVNAEALEGLPTPQAIGPQNRSVTIRTATVEIKALTVNGRQVTQALFKQLPYKNPIDIATAKPVGNWWGMVRYDPDNSLRHGWPVIFEYEGVLYRGRPIEPKFTETYGNLLSEYTALFKKSQALEQLFIAV